MGGALLCYSVDGYEVAGSSRAGNPGLVRRSAVSGPVTTKADSLGAQRKRRCLGAAGSIAALRLCIAITFLRTTTVSPFSPVSLTALTLPPSPCSSSHRAHHAFWARRRVRSPSSSPLSLTSELYCRSPSLIANLLSSGLSIAQDLGLHRMLSDAEFHAASLAGKPPNVRAKALIDREVRKRVLWSLAHTDWFSIPFRRNWVLSKAQITTPLPLNIHDE